MAGEDGRSVRDTLTDLRSFYFDTALSASPSALPALLSFAQPDHILFGSDWPFAPAAAVQYFAAGLHEHLAHTPFGAAIGAAVNHGNAAALFPRLASGPVSTLSPSRGASVRAAVKTRAVRALFKLADPARG
jgi:6-methylsalicylate decarboxylase